jgi:hypothetical protein
VNTSRLSETPLHVCRRTLTAPRRAAPPACLGPEGRSLVSPPLSPASRLARHQCRTLPGCCLAVRWDCAASSTPSRCAGRVLTAAEPDERRMGGGGERRGEEAAEQLEEWRQAESEGQRRRRRRGETEEREDGGRGEVGLDAKP